MDRRLLAALRLDAWAKTKSKERRALARAVADARAADLELVHEGVGDLEVPVYAYRATGFLLHLIPGGRFTMGMTDAELRRMCWYVKGVVEKVNPLDPQSADRDAQGIGRLGFAHGEIVYITRGSFVKIFS